MQAFILKDFFLVVKGSDLPVGEGTKVTNGTTVQKTGTKRKRADSTSDLEDSSDPVKKFQSIQFIVHNHLFCP